MSALVLVREIWETSAISWTLFSSARLWFFIQVGSTCLQHTIFVDAQDSTLAVYTVPFRCAAIRFYHTRECSVRLVLSTESEYKFHWIAAVVSSLRATRTVAVWTVIDMQTQFLNWHGSNRKQSSILVSDFTVRCSQWGLFVSFAPRFVIFIHWSWP